VTKRRRRREIEGGDARTQVAAARVEEVLWCGQLIKARGGLLGVRAKQGGGAPGRRERESDSTLSTARPRVGDDKRTPRVSGTRAEGGAAAALGGPAGPQAGCCAAGAGAGLAGCWACCYAARATGLAGAGAGLRGPVG
jgi:hypothetical protein